MKTIFRFGLIALAMLAMSSCTKEVTVDQVNPDTPIEFGTYLGRAAQTKASLIDLNALKTKQFGVFAYYNMTENTAPNFMYNQFVEWDSTNNRWTYDPVKYWPNNASDKLSFFAYAPYETDPATNNITLPANTAQGEPSLTFNVNNTVVSQTDLLYATALKDQLKPAKYTDKTTFAFNHALSRIGFSVQLMVDAVNGDATGETDDDTTASGTLDTDETTVSVTAVELIGNFHNSGKLNLSTGVWSEFSTAQTTYTLGNANFEDVSTGVTVTDTKLIKDDSYMMLIPKDFTADGFTIKVTYDVRTLDNNLNGGKSTITNVITSDPVKMNLEQGKAYNFSLHLGLDSVQFDVTSVADWGSETDTAVNVPVNNIE